MTDGTWRAWGRSTKLIEQIAKIGPTHALELRFSSEGDEFIAWIEPPAAATAPGSMPPGVTGMPSPASPEIAAPIPAEAKPFQGHHYLFVPGKLSWTEAKSAAEARGGHLAVITSREEDEFAKALLGSALAEYHSLCWIGASEDSPQGSWKWVNSEPFAYTGWGKDEPNRDRGRPEVTHPYWVGYFQAHGTEGITWNDASPKDGNWQRQTVGYLIEWSGAAEPSVTSAAPAPTPAAADLTAIPGFETRVEAYLKDRNARLEALAANYGRGLDARLGQAAESGDLDLATAFRDEKARLDSLRQALTAPPADLVAAVSAPPTLPALPEGIPALVAALRQTWVTERQKIHDDLDGKLRQSLQALITELTKARKLDQAAAVAAFREQVGKTGDAPASSPSAAVAPSTPATPASVPAPPGATAPATTSLKLPQWLEEAAMSGGKLRIWGQWEGKPIDEREALKEFRESDYTQVMAAAYGLILGKRQRGGGKCFVLATDVPGIGSNRLRESKEIQGIERVTRYWAAEDRIFSDTRSSGSEQNLGDDSLFVGDRSGALVVRDRAGEWSAKGYHFTNPEDPAIVPLMKSICDQLKTDQPSLISMNNYSLVWYTRDLQLMGLNITLRPGVAKETPIPSRPKERLVELMATSDAIYGRWIAIGESGAVYADQTGGFDKPVPELTPALTLRRDSAFSAGRQSRLLAAQKPDGTWHALGTEEALIAQITSLGPAIDLDVYIRDDQNQFVLWIEPNSSLKPR